MTLTYSQKNLPEGGNLDHTHIQKFMKKVRDFFGYPNLKYLVCGEYGPNGTKRPHYHMILFGLTDYQVKAYLDTWPGTCLYKDSKTGEIFRKLWDKGFVKAGYGVPPGRAAYVASYTTKKLRNKTYENNGKKPPYLIASHGIGRTAALVQAPRYLKLGYIPWNEHKYPIPRYYFKIIGLDRREFYEPVLQKISEKLIVRAHNESIEVFSNLNFIDDDSFLVITSKKEWYDLAYKFGRVIFFDRKWYIVTKKFKNWVESLAKQRCLHLKKKWEKSREGVPDG